MFKFESEEIQEKFIDLVKSTTGEEPCYDSDQLKDKTDVFVEPWTSKRVSRNTAEEMCAGCDVYDKCKAYAIAAKEPFGIWGGTRPQDRGIKPKFKG